MTEIIKRDIHLDHLPDVDLKPKSDIGAITLDNSLPIWTALAGYILACRSKHRRDFFKGLAGAVVGFGAGTLILNFAVNPNAVEEMSQGGGSEFKSSLEPTPQRIKNSKESNIVLPSDVKKIENLLGNDNVRSELFDTFNNASKAWARSDLKEGNEPKLKELQSFNPSIYVPKTKQIQPGEWWETHYRIASKIDPIPRTKSGLEEYVSGVTFSIRQAPEIKTFLITNLNGNYFNPNDLLVFQQNGYVVMRFVFPSNLINVQQAPSEALLFDFNWLFLP